jgi:hypothetical protein
MKSLPIDDAALRRLIEEHHKCSAELDRLKTLQPKHERERDEMIKNGDVTSPEMLRKCSDLQLRVDLIATKIPQLEARIAEIKAAMPDVFDAARVSLDAAVETLFAAAKKVAEESLARLISSPDERAEIAEKCNEPRRIASLGWHGLSGWAIKDYPILYASQLIEAIDAFRAATK